MQNNKRSRYSQFLSIFLVFSFLLSVAVFQVQAQEIYGPVTTGYDCLNESGNLIGASTVFPEGIENVAILFSFQDVPTNTSLAIRKYKDNVNQGNDAQITIEGDRNFCFGTGSNTAGQWSIEFIINGNIVAEAEWQVTNDPIVSKIQTGTDVRRISRTVEGESTSFPSGTDVVYVTFTVWNMPETIVRIKHNGEEVRVITNQGEGNAWVAIRNEWIGNAVPTEKSPLPDGSYVVEFEYNGVAIEQYEFSVGE